jgi:hypothetical protein
MTIQKVPKAPYFTKNSAITAWNPRVRPHVLFGRLKKQRQAL